MIELWAFGLGAILGSFLNAVIYRVPRYISLINPGRSFCPSCQRQLSLKENIPIISYLLQLGNCLCKRERIPFRYLIVELLSAAAGVGTVRTFGVTPTAAVVFVLCLTLIALSFIDFDHKIIPDRISKPGIIIGLLLGILSEYTNLFRCSPFQELCPVTQGALDSLLGYAVGGGFFVLIGQSYLWLTHREGLGWGDIKLLAMTGAVLGIHSVAPTIILGSLCGAVVGIAAMLASGGGRHTEIPFGPWLSVGAILYIFFDPPLFRLY